MKGEKIFVLTPVVTHVSVFERYVCPPILNPRRKRFLIYQLEIWELGGFTANLHQ